MDFSALYPIFTSFWGVMALVLFFGGSIFIHELGHFLAARKRGLIVKSFSIGFGPRLFGWRRNGIDYKVSLLPLGGYVALPQLADMRQIEDVGDVDTENLPPISYTDKVIVAAAGAFFNIVLALIISVVVWIVGRPVAASELTTTVGSVIEEFHLPSGPVPGPAWKAGIRPGDRILAIDGTPVNTFADIHLLIMTGSGREDDDRRKTVITAERDGQTIDFEVTPVLPVINERSGDRVRMVGIQAASPVVVGAVTPNSPAERANLQPGDLVLAIDDNAVYSLQNITDYLNKNHPETVRLTVERNGTKQDIVFSPELVAESKPLVRIQSGDDVLDLVATGDRLVGHDSIDLATPATVVAFSAKGQTFEGIRLGEDRLEDINDVPVLSLEQARELLVAGANTPLRLDFNNGRRQRDVIIDGESLTVSVVPPRTRIMAGFRISPVEEIIHPTPLDQFYESVTMIGRILHGLTSPSSDIGLRHLSGPIGIGRIIYQFSISDFQRLLWFVVLLNINLAILNLLPIPVLDGGHIAFATIAKLRGKALPHGFINAVQGSFMLMLFGLIVYVIFFDSMRWLGDSELKREIERERIYWLDQPVFGYEPKDN